MMTSAKGGARSQRTLCIDIGGTGLKTMIVSASGKPLSERVRIVTPRPATPRAICAALLQVMPDRTRFDRVSVGFPGVVVDGVTRTAPNLHPAWKGFELATWVLQSTGRPTRVLNDAGVQGHGVVQGLGTEICVTLGTGFGFSLFVNGHYVPNVEFGHHPFRKGRTYEGAARGRGVEAPRQAEVEHDARGGGRAAPGNLQLPHPLPGRRQRPDGCVQAAQEREAGGQRRGAPGGREAVGAGLSAVVRGGRPSQAGARGCASSRGTFRGAGGVRVAGRRWGRRLRGESSPGRMAPQTPWSDRRRVGARADAPRAEATRPAWRKGGSRDEWGPARSSRGVRVCRRSPTRREPADATRRVATRISPRGVVLASPSARPVHRLVAGLLTRCRRGPGGRSSLGAPASR